MGASETRLSGAFSKGGKCAESPPTFICGKRRKNRRKLVKKNIPSLGVVFTFDEGQQKRGSYSYVPSIEEEIRPT
ncbi:hypothetical protein HKD37_17G048573 [Glycine soja]